MFQAGAEKVQFRVSVQLNRLLSDIEAQNSIDSELLDTFCATVPGKLKQDPKYYEILQTLSWQVRFSSFYMALPL
jgi:hypothetical protein